MKTDRESWITLVFIIRAALWAEKFGRTPLHIAGIEKNMFGKLVIAVNSVGHSIRILNERAAGD